MKRIFCLIATLAISARVFSAQPPELDQLKADLIGQSMGGREKCWKFQSPDQIKSLVIKNKSEDSQKRVYTLTLVLQANHSSEIYLAEARVEYSKDTKAAARWKIHHVGLLSISKVP